MTDQKYSDQVEAEGKMVRRLGLYCAQEAAALVFLQPPQRRM